MHVNDGGRALMTFSCDPALDHETLNEILSEINRDRFGAMVEDMVSELSDQIAKITPLIDAKDWAGLRSTAHRAKSTALTFGAGGLAYLLQAIEQAASSEDEETARKCQDSIPACLEKTVAAFGKMLS